MRKIFKKPDSMPETPRSNQTKTISVEEAPIVKSLASHFEKYNPEYLVRENEASA